MAQVIQFEDAQRQFERDKKVVNLLVAGVQPHRVAEEMSITKAEVYEAHTRMMGQVPPDYRARALDLSLRTLDALKAAWFARAVDPNAPATVAEMATKIILRVEDARADRVGIRQLPTREDALDDLKDGETSTENLRRIFDEIRGKVPPTIEGEAQAVDDPEDEPSNDDGAA